jgi:hypothetical protein
VVLHAGPLLLATFAAIVRLPGARRLAPATQREKSQHERDGGAMTQRGARA